MRRRAARPCSADDGVVVCCLARPSAACAPGSSCGGGGLYPRVCRLDAAPSGAQAPRACRRDARALAIRHGCAIAAACGWMRPPIRQPTHSKSHGRLAIIRVRGIRDRRDAPQDRPFPGCIHLRRLAKGRRVPQYGDAPADAPQRRYAQRRCRHGRVGGCVLAPAQVAPIAPASHPAA